MDDLDSVRYEQLLQIEDENLGLRRLIQIAQRDLMKR